MYCMNRNRKLVCLVFSQLHKSFVTLFSNFQLHTFAAILYIQLKIEYRYLEIDIMNTYFQRMSILVLLVFFSCAGSPPRADARRYLVETITLWPSRGEFSDQVIMSALSRLLSEKKEREELGNEER